MKDWSICKRLIVSFTFCNICLLASNTIGYLAVKAVIHSSDPENFARTYGLAMSCELAVVVALTILSLVGISKSLKAAIVEITRAGEKLAQGDTDIEVKKLRNDELGTITDLLNQIIRMNQEESKIVEVVAEGDLTIDVTPKGASDRLGNSLKRLVLTNRQTLGKIDEAAACVMTSASEVAAASESLAQGSTEQASAIEEITASIDDVTSKTRQNAQEANDAASKMRIVIADIDKGNRSMHEMVTAMADINSSSENISKIIKVIDDIAFQTNILALNAAVEAARAGEAGMGFAVVAEEVRNLAAKSSQAAAETADMIEDSIRKVHHGSGIAGETAKAMEEISRVVTESEEIIRGIAESSNYQATAMDQIDQAVGQVSTVVQTNSATSQQCAAASQELSGQASRMKGLLAVYKIGQDAASEPGFIQVRRNQADPNEQIISLGDGFGKY